MILILIKYITSKLAGKQGLLLVDAPEELGGVGGDFLSAMIVNEETGYHNTSALGLVF